MPVSDLITGRKDASAILTCASCGNQNNPDSRFCRHCGASLIEGAAPSPGAADEETHSPEEIDARRARQLLDRALTLSERGRGRAAILACRQAVALDAESTEALSMLALLYERNGDIEEAIAAYEKVLELEPDSPLDRESLDRLRETRQQQAGTPVFQFDDNELFGEPGEPIEAPPAESSGNLAAPATGTAGSMAATAPVDGRIAQSGLTANDGGDASRVPRTDRSLIRDTMTAAAVAVPAPGPAVVTAPRATTLVTPATLTASPPATAVAYPTAPIVSPGERPEGWRSIAGHPSFYIKTMPLAVTAAASLLFMLWARSAAVSRYAVAPPPTAEVITEDAGSIVTPESQMPENAPVTNVPPPAAGDPNEGLPINNGVPRTTSAAPAPPGGSTAAGPSRVAPTRRAAPSRANAPRPAPARRAPRSGGAGPTLPAPAPRPSGGAGGNDQALNRALGNLRRPEVVLPAPRDSAPPAASTRGISTPAGNAENLRGPLGRGYIRVTPERPAPSAAPPRPDTSARQAERAARDAAREGRPDAAVRSATSAINASAGQDTGWRYQQRALLQLERGDNARAVDDFQTAIAAYRDQIARGIRIEEARQGIRACESGRRLALANMRGG